MSENSRQNDCNGPEGLYVRHPAAIIIIVSNMHLGEGGDHTGRPDCHGF